MSITSIQNSAPSEVRRRRQATPPVTPAPEPAPATVLLIQRGEHAAAGLLAATLTDHGLTHDTVQLSRGDVLPAPDGFPVAVLLGTGDDLALGASPAIIDWAAAADRAGTRIFAIGTGAHALARALGGDSAPKGRAQRGWISVTSVDPELISSGPWLAWSDRPLVPPPGSEVLATSRAGVQAFRHSGHVGVQFHPQATPELIRNWIERSDEVVDYQGVEESTVRDFPAAAPAARRLFEAFLATGASAHALAA